MVLYFFQIQTARNLRSTIRENKRLTKAQSNLEDSQLRITGAQTKKQILLDTLMDARRDFVVLDENFEKLTGDELVVTGENGRVESLHKEFKLEK